MAKGGQALAIDGTASIAAHLIEHTHEGDVVILFSNGDFEGLHHKLLEGLAAS